MRSPQSSRWLRPSFLLLSFVLAALLAGASQIATARSIAIVQPEPARANATSEVSRSVGLMTGAPGDVSPLQASATQVEVSRSVGLMTGAPADASTLGATDAEVEVSRSVGLMEGAPGASSLAQWWRSSAFAAAR